MTVTTRFDHPAPPTPEPRPTLWDSLTPPVVVEVIDPPPGSIQEAFEAFHQANPWVAEALRRLAVDLVRHGRKRISTKMLFEVLRYEVARTTEDPSSSFKLNNNYTAPYARMLMSADPELVGVFETRRSETDAHFQD